MEEADNEIRTENITELIGRANSLAKELPGPQFDVGMAVARGILDLEYKEKLFFGCAGSKSFTFSKRQDVSQNTIVSFDPAYKELKSVGLSLPIQSAEELVRQRIPALVRGIQTLNSTLVHGSSLSNHPPCQQPFNSLQSGRQSQYRERNPNDDRCYICNEPGHYTHQCPRKGNQRQSPQQYWGQRYPQPQYNALLIPLFSILLLPPFKPGRLRKFVQY